MDCNKEAHIIGFSIHMNKFYVYYRVELAEVLKDTEYNIEIVYGLKRIAPILNDDGSPIDQKFVDCRCQKFMGIVRER